MEDKELKEMLICAYKNSTLLVNSYGRTYIKGFTLDYTTEDEYVDKNIKVKRWFTTSEKVVREFVRSTKNYTLEYKSLKVDLTEEEYKNLKNYPKEKYEQQLIKQLEELCNNKQQQDLN